MDLCENLSTGEGLLVGSFARALFLVHSECADSAYINSRPFRVNSGAVPPLPPPWSIPAPRMHGCCPSP